MKKVYFHIGFHKTGTTWLQTQIFSNSDHFNLINNFREPWKDEIIQYLVLTPLHKFQAKELTQKIERKIESNKINFISAERLSGHPVSGGYDAYDIAKKIHRTFPNARIIMNTREPSSFKISCYKQIVKEGFPGKFDSLEQNTHWKTVHPSKIYFQQNDLINYYKDLFGSTNLLIQTFEDFSSNPRLYFNNLSQFVGINIPPPTYKKKINGSISNRRIRAIRTLNRFRETELNPFPIIKIGERFSNYLSIILSIFFSNSKFN
ncbi:sulfotransferase domain-containing protein [uncultured Draconibacterium sp.]|uniref:sulfotransferase domain-containing protein n=1 Tax=uncultured Draconibacterium sp. TaxID=1573823 RepID=UPI00321775F6